MRSIFDFQHVFDDTGHARGRLFSPPSPSFSLQHQRDQKEAEYQHRHPSLGKSTFVERDPQDVDDRGHGLHGRRSPRNSRIFVNGRYHREDAYGSHEASNVKGPTHFDIFGSTGLGHGRGGGGGGGGGGEYSDHLGNTDDSDFEDEDSCSLRRKRIAMFDILNLYTSLGTLCKALGLLAARTWRRMETLFLALLFRGEEANRLSSIIVAWLVLATVAVLTALCIKRCCCDRSLYIELIQDDDDDDASRPDRRRKSTIKRKRRVNAAASAATVDNGKGKNPKDPQGGRQQRRFSQRLRDKKESESQKRAARWINLCLEAVYEDDAVRDTFLRKWMEALNRHLAEKQATEAVSVL